MVSYCCVKGCKNNSRNKRKNPNSNITFHALPTNTDLRAKWLKAIGRPNWEPSLHMRLCSVHFDNSQISREGHRTRIKDDACPNKFLPVNSNFEASILEVCRICLATDIKMYSLQDGILKLCIGNIYRMIENIHIEGMPQFVCYECGACLIKFYYLMEKSMIAQATLLDIFAHNGELSMDLIKKQDRKQLNLNSSLGYYKRTHIYKYSYDCDDKSSIFIKNNDTNVIDYNSDDVFKTNGDEFQIENDFINKIWENTLKPDIKKIEHEEEGKIFNDITKINSDDPIELKENNSEVNETDCISEGDDFLNDYDSHTTKINNEKKIDTCYKSERRSTMKNNSEKSNGFTHSEVNIQEHFDIMKLSLQEQVEEWKRARVNTKLMSETIFKCEICSRIFAHVQPYRNHIAGHNPERGKEECPVCKLRFKDKLHIQSHRRRIHGNKFYCKKCPKVFTNIAVARKHYRWHSGHRYKCGWCAFTSAHESAVGAHARTCPAYPHAAGAYACAHCGLPCRSARGLALHCTIAHKQQPEIEISREYKCELCNVYFTSEGARRVHLLTSKHKTSLCDSTTIDETVKNTCDKCGANFQSPLELKAHIEAKHRNVVRRKTSWRRRDDCYPILCEHCGETLNSRRVHYWHVRRQHPKQKHLYQPVITAVCEICGKGFQNSTKLHLHELRHGQPTVKCVQCPRLFYDKYAAAIHGAVHEPAKPHACRTCGRTFKLKGNLHRHSKVHSSVAPYECSMCGKKFKYSYSVNLHVRTVHYKMPHPPRKKRKIAINNGPSPDSDNIII